MRQDQWQSLGEKCDVQPRLSQSDYPSLSHYCWWFRNPANQLRLVVYPIICKALYISGGSEASTKQTSPQTPGTSSIPFQHQPFVSPRYFTSQWTKFAACTSKTRKHQCDKFGWIKQNVCFEVGKNSLIHQLKLFKQFLGVESVCHRR